MDCNKDLFSVDELVMILKNNDIKTGHNKLFKYWRENGLFYFLGHFSIDEIKREINV